MKARLFALALMGSTALSTPAYAMPPVLGFISGIATAFGVPAVAGVLGGVGTAAFSAGFFVGGIGAGFAASQLGKLVIGMGVNALTQSLLGGGSRYTPPATSNPSERLANFSQPMMPMQNIYGITRVGASWGFNKRSSNARWYTNIVAGHRTVGPVTHYLGERAATIDEDNFIDTAPMAGFGQIWPFTGENGYVEGFHGEFAELTEAHDFKGLSGAHIRSIAANAQDLTTVYPDGTIWPYLPVWQGHDWIYDPRSDSWGYSNNAALVIAHWITTKMGGLVDWDAVAIEADVSDELVTNRFGATQPRWTLNGSYFDNEDRETVRAKLLTACGGWFSESPNGLVTFYVGRWIEPTLILTDEDFISFSDEQESEGPQVPTELLGKYVEPLQGWREAPVVQPVNPDGRVKRSELSYDFITNANQISRVLKVTARRLNPQSRITGQLNMIGYEVSRHRYVRFISASRGRTYDLEVDQLIRRADGISFEFGGISAAADDWAHNAATEELIPAIAENAEEDITVEDPTGVSASSAGGGTLLVDWDPTTSSLSQQVRLSSGGVEQTYTVPFGERPFLIGGLIDGATYDPEVRNVNATFRVSEWVASTPSSVTIVSNTTAPAAHDAVTAALDGTDIDLTWTAPNDPNYAATRIYRAEDSTAFGDAALIHTEYGPPSSADAYTDTAPGTGADFSYWFEPINGSGVAGTRSGPETVNIP